MKSLKTIIIITIMLLGMQMVYAQRGTSVSPSRLYYKLAPGGYKSQTIHITNSGKTTESFTVNFANFSSPGKKGKTLIDTTMNSEHGCSQWLSASPSFFEIGPGETQDIEILLQLPNIPEANTVRWAIINVKSAYEKKGADQADDKTVGMHIVQSFQFGIHVFQTPPAVTFKEVTVRNFYRDSTITEIPDSITVDSITTEPLINLIIEVENTGDAIANCAPYLDLINIKTGYSHRLKGKGFTVLPGGFREITFILPEGIPSGNYSILGVVDYGSKTDFAASEIKLTIP